MRHANEFPFSQFFLRVLLILVFLATPGCSKRGDQKVVRQGCEVTYAAPLTGSQIDDALTSLGDFCEGDTKSLDFRKSGDKIEWRAVTVEGAQNQKHLVWAFKTIAKQLSIDAFDCASIDVHMCDPKFDTVKVITIPASDCGKASAADRSSKCKPGPVSFCGEQFPSGATDVHCSARGKKISDLSPLICLPRLKKLVINNSKITNLAPLETLQRLEDLHLYGAPVSDLKPLAQMPNLRKLGLQNTAVRDLAPLGNSKQLRVLLLYRTKVTDLGPLAGLNQLQELGFDAAPVNSLAPLAKLNGLRELSLNQTKVDDLKPLAGLKNLQALSFGNTQVADLKPLTGLVRLEKLALHGTPVKDLSPLLSLHKLKELNIGTSSVTDLKPLYGMDKLRKLGVFGAKLSESQIAALQRQLPKLKIDR